MTRARRDPPRINALVVDRATGAVVARVDATHGLAADAELRAVPWCELARRYRVQLTDLADARAAVARALAAYDASPRGRWEAQRRDVARVNALVADALGRLP